MSRPHRPPHPSDDVRVLHRHLSSVTKQLIVSGDLAEDPNRATQQLKRWQQAGVTHILDLRYEWSDEDLVAEHAPSIVYCSAPTDDDGRRQPDDWFDTGIAFAIETFSHPRAVLLVHCHMGVNRAPSMAFRILLELGWDPIEALDTIREARPIANIGYATDALNHYHSTHAVPATRQAEDRDRLETWVRGYSTTTQAEADLANLDGRYTDREFEVDYADYLDWLNDEP